jgi:hypothetical protein
MPTWREADSGVRVENQKGRLILRLLPVKNVFIFGAPGLNEDITLDGELISIAGLFLTASSILTVALADARNEPLKTGLSIAGVIVALGWVLCTIDSFPSTSPRMTPLVLGVLSILAIVGWSVSVCIHGRNWSRLGRSLDLREAETDEST